MPVAVYPALQSAVLLCIEDNEDVLECEKSFLESFGYTVLTAASGGKGLELASKYSVDDVIAGGHLDRCVAGSHAPEVDTRHKRECPLGAMMDTYTQPVALKRQYRALEGEAADRRRDVGGWGVGSAGSASARSQRQPGFQLAPAVSGGTTGGLRQSQPVAGQSDRGNFAAADSSIA